MDRLEKVGKVVEVWAQAKWRGITLFSTLKAAVKTTRVANFVIIHGSPTIAYSDINFDSVESEYSNIRYQIMDLSNHTCP